MHKQPARLIKNTAIATTTLILAGTVLTNQMFLKFQKPFRLEKDRMEDSRSVKNLFTTLDKKINFLVIGHSWAEGTFRYGRESLERSFKSRYGLEANFRILSQSGATIYQTEKQLERGLQEGTEAIVILTGRNDWGKNDKKIRKNFKRLFDKAAETGRKVYVFTCPFMPEKFEGSERFNEKVKFMNGAIEDAAREYGFALIRLDGKDFGRMQDSRHPVDYYEVRRLFETTVADEMGLVDKTHLMQFNATRTDATKIVQKKAP